MKRINKAVHFKRQNILNPAVFKNMTENNKADQYKLKRIEKRIPFFHL
ncbi:MAG: hypothetical protein QM631_15505 [Dysgonomonas sp.]